MFIKRWQFFYLQNKIQDYVYIYCPKNIQSVKKYTLPSNHDMKKNRLDLMLLLMIYFFIVYYATREKKVYFANAMFDACAKRGQQSHEDNKCFSRVAHDFFSSRESKNTFFLTQYENFAFCVSNIVCKIADFW